MVGSLQLPNCEKVFREFVGTDLVVRTDLADTDFVVLYFKTHSPLAVQGGAIEVAKLKTNF